MLGTRLADTGRIIRNYFTITLQAQADGRVKQFLKNNPKCKRLLNTDVVWWLFLCSEKDSENKWSNVREYISAVPNTSLEKIGSLK